MGKVSRPPAIPPRPTLFWPKVIAIAVVGLGLLYLVSRCQASGESPTPTPVPTSAVVSPR